MLNYAEVGTPRILILPQNQSHLLNFFTTFIKEVSSLPASGRRIVQSLQIPGHDSILS